MSVSQTLTVSCDGRNIPISARLRLTGGHLLLFIHGLGCAKECFDGAFDATGLKDFSLCAFDLPGHGASHRVSALPYSLYNYAKIANAVIDSISPARVSIVGHSMGGAVGLLASQRREDLDRFVSVDGNLVAEDCGMASRATAQQPLSAFITHGFHDFVKGLSTSPRSDFRAWASWYEEADPAAVHGIARSLVEWSDSGQLLRFFQTLRERAYIYGAEDDKSYLLPRLSNTEVCRVAGSGHFPMVNNPASFYLALENILSGANTEGVVARGEFDGLPSLYRPESSGPVTSLAGPTLRSVVPVVP